MRGRRSGHSAGVDKPTQLCLNNVAGNAWYCGWGNSHTLTGGFDHTYAGSNLGF